MTSALGGAILGFGVTMDAANLLQLTGATAAGTTLTYGIDQSGIGGNVIMNANIAGAAGATALNFADIDMAGITGSLSMTSVYGVMGGNTMLLSGGTGMSGGTGTIVESYIGGLSMVSSGVAVGATGGDNVANIDLSDVRGNIVMTAGGTGADNELEVTGGTNGFGVTYTSGISGGIAMTSALDANGLALSLGTVGAGITMDAGTSNWAKLTASTVTGGISQTAGTWNFLNIDPCTVTGDVVLTSLLGGYTGSPAGSAPLQDATDAASLPYDRLVRSGSQEDTGNYVELLGATAGTTSDNTVSQSLVGGNFIVNANLAGDTGAAAANYLNINMGGITGYLSMTSVYGVAGGNYLELAGGIGASAGISTIVESYIGGLTMDSRSGITGGTGGDNNANINLSDVRGSIVMSASGIDADNRLWVDGGTDGAGVTAMSSITGGVSMTSALGINTLNLDFATISGGLNIENGTTGVLNSISEGANASIAGGITTGIGDDWLWLFGTVSGGISTGIGDDYLQVYSSISGDIDMGAGDNQLNLNGFAGATFTFSSIDTGGATGSSVAIGASGLTENLFITGSFGSAGATMYVENTIDQLTFVGSTAGAIQIAGDLITVNGATVNTLDMDALTTSGSTLITANSATTWDILDATGGVFNLIGTDDVGVAAGNVFNIVSGGQAINLTNWDDGTLTITGIDFSVGATVGVHFQDTGTGYKAVADGHTWQLTSTNTAGTNVLALSVIV
jgi:hypothetical protein